MKLSEVLNKTKLDVINILYDNPFILNKYLKNYKLIVIDCDLVYIDKQNKKMIALYAGAYDYDLTKLENSLAK